MLTPREGVQLQIDIRDGHFASGFAIAPSLEDVENDGSKVAFGATSASSFRRLEVEESFGVGTRLGNGQQVDEETGQFLLLQVVRWSFSEYEGGLKEWNERQDERLQEHHSSFSFDVNVFLRYLSKCGKNSRIK